MRKIVILFFFSLFFVIPLFAEDELNIEATEHQPAHRIFIIPGFSYQYTSFDDLQIHEPSANLNIVRLNTEEQGKLLFISLRYSPDILNTEKPYPQMYHNAGLSITQMLDRRMFSFNFMSMTEKPVYGGTNSFMGMAVYSYKLIEKDHFSMNLGAGLLVMNLGVKLDNGMSWLFWPVPFFGFAWKYEWFTLNLIPGIKLVVAPNKPFNFILESEFSENKASVWYTASDVFGAGLGIKNVTSGFNLADGRKYEITYNALYGAVKLFKIVEINGGWAFDGKDGEDMKSWDSMLSMFGYSGSGKHDSVLGNGFFISVSARVNMQQ